MKCFILLFFSFLFCTSSILSAQDADQLIPYRKGELWGYANATGDLVIPAIYSKVEFFACGIAKVSKEKKHGVINKRNEILYPCEYVDSDIWRTDTETKRKVIRIERVNHNFSKIFTVIHGEAHRVRYVNSKGQFISDEIYSWKGITYNNDFRRYKTNHPDLFIASKGDKIGLLNNEAKEISKFDYNRFRYNHNGTFSAKKDSLWGILDTFGNEISSFEYKSIRSSFDQVIVTRKDGLNAVVNQKGEVVFPFIYQGLRETFKNYACARIDNKYKVGDSTGTIIPGIESQKPITMKDDYLILVKNDKYGLVDWQGKELVPFIYEHLSPINDDLLIAKLDGKAGTINTSNQIIMPLSYDELNLRREHKLIIAIRNKKQGLFTFENKTILPVEYDKIKFSDNKFIFSKRNTCGYFFTQSNTKSKFKYDTQYNQSSNSKFQRVTIDTKYRYNETGVHGFIGKAFGVIDSVGTEIIRPTYANLDISFIDKGIIIAKSIRYRAHGLINLKNETILPFQFHHLYATEGGIIIGIDKRDKKTRFYDYAGNQLFNTSFEQARSFFNGRAAVKQNGKWGFINSKGELVVPCKYHKVRPFKNNITMVSIDKEYSGYINLNGKEFFEN